MITSALFILFVSAFGFEGADAIAVRDQAAVSGGARTDLSEQLSVVFTSLGYRKSN